MIKVIQTNQSLNVFGQERDFQSFVKKSIIHQAIRAIASRKFLKTLLNKE